MKFINKLEKKIEDWLKPIPGLPRNSQKWIADNVWWVTLVSAILTAISVLVIFNAIDRFMLLEATVGMTGSIGSISYGTGWLASSIVALIFGVVIAVLMAIAVNPLKSKSRKGWYTLFMVYLVATLKVIVGAVLTFDFFGFIFNIIFGAIGLAIGGYFLFQIRSYFGSTVKAKHVTK